MSRFQAGILADVPGQARYLSFSMLPGTDPRNALKALSGFADGKNIVVGIGASMARFLGVDLPGLKFFPVFDGARVGVPSTPRDIWCWLRGEDRGELIQATREVTTLLADAFYRESAIDAFRYGSGLDLTGYEDGTENPKDAAALETAIAEGQGEGVDGSSFVAVQQWVHDLDHFQSMPQEDQDNTIGRRKSDNEELDDAPATAHVKRTAQESFEPEAFIVRRSMPWADASREGLVFVAFSHSFDAFDSLLKRMAGAEDGVIDALFKFTRPVSGAYFWCPPIHEGELDLRALGIS